jgi:uncharacterized protein YecE (DUF72 family)
MAVIGCSGFPVPATRYLREFLLVEIADTALGVPGPALVRRWLREAPDGFVFTALAPKDLVGDGFKPTPTADAAWDNFLPVARDLGARAVVVLSPPEVPAGKATRAAVHALFEKLARPGVPALVWEPPPAWELRDAEAAVKDLPVIVARDPARHPPFAKGALAYYRLPGPAGYKSRYEDPTLEAATQTVRETQAGDAMVVFANVDMYADAKRMRKLLEG